MAIASSAPAAACTRKSKLQGNGTRGHARAGGCGSCTQTASDLLTVMVVAERKPEKAWENQVVNWFW